MSLTATKAALCKVAAEPYPDGLSISPRWRDHQLKNFQEIMQLETVEQAITRAQSHDSGFDHRQCDDHRIGTVNFKIAELGLKFPAFNFDNYIICESEFSVKESLVRCFDTKLPLSSIFLTHLYFYLRTTGLMDASPQRILEIGSGYGGLARIYKIMSPNTVYTLVDLPESLFSAHVFLTANFPEAKIFYVQDHLPIDIDSYDFVLVPAQFADVLAGQEFDLAINTGSFQEMTMQAMLYWMDFIQQSISVKALYSWNYFLNDKTKFDETKEECCSICPVLDEFWVPRYFRINEPILTVDADQRNWLEVFVERIPKHNWPSIDRLKYANRLIDIANSFRTGTQYWYGYLWMAIWVNPGQSLLDSMLKGLQFFIDRKTFGVTNHLDVSEFGETKFYSRMRETLFGAAKPEDIS